MGMMMLGTQVAELPGMARGEGGDGGGTEERRRQRVAREELGGTVQKKDPYLSLAVRLLPISGYENRYRLSFLSGRSAALCASSCRRRGIPLRSLEADVRAVTDGGRGHGA